MRRYGKSWILSAGILLLLLIIPAGLAAQTQDGDNLLDNPGFEGTFVTQCCQPGSNIIISEVHVAVGWRGWWIDPDGETRIANCQEITQAPGSANDCVAWHRPEFGEATPFANRIHSGSNAQKYFTFFSVHAAGLYQTVSGINPGDELEFSIYMHAWSANGSGLTSSGQGNMNMQIGIDPLGGSSPYSAAIVWSPAVDYYDDWGFYSITAVAQRDTVTVFTRSRPQYALEHNDIYLDDARLVVVNTAAAGTAQPRTDSGPSATPRNIAALTPTPPSSWATSTPQANGEIWWVVHSGDTLRVLAFYNDTTVEEILALNSMSGSVVTPGQRILVKVVDPPTPTPVTPEITPTVLATATQLVGGVDPTAIPAAVTLPYGDLCVVTYNDLNTNAINDNEPLLANVQIALSNDTGPLTVLSSTADSNSTCFGELPSGSYEVRILLPAGYRPTTAALATVTVTTGNAVTVVFGLAQQDLQSDSIVSNGNIIPLAAGITGIVLVLLALIGIIVLFLRNR